MNPGLLVVPLERNDQHGPDSCVCCENPRPEYQLVLVGCGHVKTIGLCKICAEPYLQTPDPSRSWGR